MNCYFDGARIELDERETRSLKANLEFRFLVFEVASNMANDSGRAIKVIGSFGSTYRVNPKDGFEHFNALVRATLKLLKPH